MKLMMKARQNRKSLRKHQRKNQYLLMLRRVMIRHPNDGRGPPELVKQKVLTKLVKPNPN